MTRAQMLLVFVAAGIVAIIAGVITSLVVTSRHHDDTSQTLQAVANATATAVWNSHAIRVEPAITAIAIGTPSRLDSSQPVTLMFCDPLHERVGAGLQVATIGPNADATVVYATGDCDPDVDASGAVLVRNNDGTTRRATISYVPVNSLNSAVFESVVWTPAKGDLNGVPTIMTGRYLKPDAAVVFDSLGTPRLNFNMTDDGQEIFGSMSERMIGLPLATFLDGQPLRGEQGQILAPTILSRITDSGQSTGLSLDDAKRIAELINNGLAR